MMNSMNPIKARPRTTRVPILHLRSFQQTCSSGFWVLTLTPVVILARDPFYNNLSCDKHWYRTICYTRRIDGAHHQSKADDNNGLMWRRDDEGSFDHTGSTSRRPWSRVHKRNNRTRRTHPDVWSGTLLCSTYVKSASPHRTLNREYRYYEHSSLRRCVLTTRQAGASAPIVRDQIFREGTRGA
jgi:hypothetical protein